jgi:hypothetical protein
MLQQSLPILHSGESTQATIGVTVLCRGEYEIGASVEEARLLRSFDEYKEREDDASHHHDGIKDTFGADVVRRRRIWHAKETCVIHAHD